MSSEVVRDYEAGVADVRSGRHQRAIELLSGVMDDPSLDFGRREHARMLVGYAKGQLDDWTGAAECFRQAMINDIECLPAHTALGHAYLMGGRLRDAIETFRVAVQKDPKSAQARHGLAWTLLEEGREIDEALYQAQEALRLNPDSAAVRDTVGWALYRHGETEAAAEQLAEAIRLDPDHAVILAHWREVRGKLGQHGQHGQKEARS